MMVASKATEEMKFKDKIANFILRNRKLIIMTAVLFVAALAGLIIFFEVRKNVIEKSTVLVEKAETAYLEYRNMKDSDEKNKKYDAVSKSLDEIIANYQGYYAAQRASYIKGSLAFEKKDWDSAAKTWTEMAAQYPKSHLASIARMNAAAAYEENGNIDKAVETLITITTTEGDFPEMSRVIFSLGRLNEEKKDFTKAAEYYNKLIEDYAASSWTKLARDRIILLKVQNKVSK